MHENYKLLMMRPNRLMGKIYYHSHIQKKQDCSGLCPMWVAHGKQNGASQPERFTVQTRIGMKNFEKFWTVKCSNWALLDTFRLTCTVSIATYNLHQTQDEQRAVLYLNTEMINIHLPGLIIIVFTWQRFFKQVYMDQTTTGISERNTKWSKKYIKCLWR